MTSVSRRESSDDLCRRIEDVLSGHDLQRTTPTHAAMGVDEVLCPEGNSIDVYYGSVGGFTYTRDIAEGSQVIPHPREPTAAGIVGDFSQHYVEHTGRPWTWTASAADTPSVWERILRRLQEAIT